MSARIVILVFAEGEFERVHTAKTDDEACGFVDGVSLGASLYGAGAIGCYRLPDDEAEMLREETSEAVAAARAAVAEMDGGQSPEGE